MTYRSSPWLCGWMAACCIALASPAASADAPPCGAASPDAAAAPPAPAAPPPAARRQWYGYQTLIVDGASLVTAPIVVGLGGLVLGGPIVHLVHHRPLAALASLGLRTALPTAGAYIGLSAAGTCHDKQEPGRLLGSCFMHGFSELIVGGLVGATIAIAVDASTLAFETDAPEDRESGVPHVTSLVPSIDPLTRSASVGLAGTF
jgi:hypothetical protein